MIYILLSVLINAVLFILFKVFDRFKINTFQAIVFNYFFALSVAFSQSETKNSLVEITTKKWFLGAVILGFLFITIFNVLAKTAQKMGISVVAVASKMSVVIPVLFGIVIYNEALGWYKMIGIILALLAVYLTSIKEKTTVNKKLIYLPIILFLGSGILDTLLKYVEKNFVLETELGSYTGTIFLTAATLGSLALLYAVITKKTKISIKNIVAGLALGIPNYYSIYFLLRALQTVGKTDSSKVFTLNNIGIVLFSTILGFLLFYEKFSLKNKIGILLAIISIALITLAN